MKREKGNVGELITSGICLLAMTVVMLVYIENAGLIQQKTQVSQIARKYILRMETVGMLSNADRAALCGELEAAGAEKLKFDGTTLSQVNYGEEIVLRIQGELSNGYAFTEKRVSTAKH